MKLKDYILGLTPEQRVRYARRCGTTHGYLMIHVLHARKEARAPLREALARESGGKVSQREVLKHFGIIS